MVISEAVREASKELKENARFEAELIVMEALEISRTQLVLDGKKEITPNQWKKIKEIINRRRKGEPLQYILGECEFMALDFYVERGVLIPRSDTETLVETMLDKADSGMDVLDICAGSGCIGISIAYYKKDVCVDLVDISDKAIEVAKKNIIRNGVSDRVEIKKMDILNEYPEKKYDIVVSNPPYIETDVIKNLQTEVKDYEPHIALDGGKDGLVFYRRIVEIAPQIMKKNGILAFEIGYNQGAQLSEIMGNSFKNIAIIKDLANNDRVAIGILK